MHIIPLNEPECRKRLGLEITSPSDNLFDQLEESAPYLDCDWTF